MVSLCEKGETPGAVAVPFLHLDREGYTSTCRPGTVGQYCVGLIAHRDNCLFSQMKIPLAAFPRQSCIAGDNRALPHAELFLDFQVEIEHLLIMLPPELADDIGLANLTGTVDNEWHPPRIARCNAFGSLFYAMICIG